MKKILMLMFFCLIPTMIQSQTVGIFDKTADWGAPGFPPQLGNNKALGSVEFEDGVYTLSGNGDDIWSDSDEGFYAYTERSGSWRLSAKVEWIDPGFNEWSKVGVMIREEGNAPDSKHYWILMRGNNFGDQIHPQMRDEKGGNTNGGTVRDDNNSIVNPPADGIYFRVTRIAHENIVFSEYSLDGDIWSLGDIWYLNLAETVAYGIAITSHEDSATLAVAEFSEVVLEEINPVASRSFSEVGYQSEQMIEVNLTVTNESDDSLQTTITEIIPEGWTASEANHDGIIDGNLITWTKHFGPGQSTLSYLAQAPSEPYPTDVAQWSGISGGAEIIGEVSLVPIQEGSGVFEYAAELMPYKNDNFAAEHTLGYAIETNAEYEIAGNGHDFWLFEDEGYYLFKEIAGDFRIETNVSVIDSTHNWSKYGIVLRQSLDAGSARYHVVLNGVGNQIERARRLIKNGPHLSITPARLPDNMVGQPVRVSLERNMEDKEIIVAWWNDNTEQWEEHLYSDANLPETVLIGLGVSSHNDNSPDLAVGNFTDLTIIEEQPTDIHHWEFY